MSPQRQRHVANKGNSLHYNGLQISGVGIDIVRIARMRERLQSESGLADVLFTPAEIAYGDSQANPAAEFAGLFAAKEALLKAVAMGLTDGFVWRDIEVIRDSIGAPSLVITGRLSALLDGRPKLIPHLSISFAKDAAVAAVIVES